LIINLSHHNLNTPQDNFLKNTYIINYTVRNAWGLAKSIWWVKPRPH